MRVAVWGGFALSAAWAQQDGFKLNDLGLAAATRSDHAEAERLYGEAITVWKRMGPQYQAHLATTQGNLAETLCMEGKRSEGARLFEESLATHRQILGSTNLRTLTIMNLLAGAYLMLGTDDRAASLFDEALRVEREHYPNDLQLARSLAGLSLMRLRAKRPDEALPLAEEALNLTLKTGSENGLDAALAYANVGEAHRWLGHTDRALPLLRKARSIYESILGPTHPRVASVLSQEGLIYMQDGKYSLAEKDMLQSLDFLAKSCPACTFEQLVSESNLGMLRLRQGKYAEADRLLTHVVSTEERYMARPGSDMATALQALAQVREKQRRYEDAAQLHKRADMILEYR
ncbi:MAG TPA: tetratricopeptide repeat protein [Bryobacteraceae bacterium]|nr:tetratricopeptide repeat protein [Bryobacteraceae bacterium]